MPEAHPFYYPERTVLVPPEDPLRLGIVPPYSRTEVRTFEALEPAAKAAGGGFGPGGGGDPQFGYGPGGGGSQVDGAIPCPTCGNIKCPTCGLGYIPGGGRRGSHPHFGGDGRRGGSQIDGRRESYPPGMRGPGGGMGGGPGGGMGSGPGGGMGGGPGGRDMGGSGGRQQIRTATPEDFKNMVGNAIRTVEQTDGGVYIPPGTVFVPFHEPARLGMQGAYPRESVRLFEPQNIQVEKVPGSATGTPPSGTPPRPPHLINSNQSTSSAPHTPPPMIMPAMVQRRRASIMEPPPRPQVPPPPPPQRRTRGLEQPPAPVNLVKSGKCCKC